MCPSKMRSSYGKLMYMLQDALNPAISDSLGLNLWKPLNMVTTFLKSKGAVKLLFDARIIVSIRPLEGIGSLQS